MLIAVAPIIAGLLFLLSIVVLVVFGMAYLAIVVLYQSAKIAKRNVPRLVACGCFVAQKLNVMWTEQAGPSIKAIAATAKKRSEVVPNRTQCPLSEWANQSVISPTQVPEIFWYYYEPSIWGESVVGPITDFEFLNRVYWKKYGSTLKIRSPSRTGNQWQFAAGVPVVANVITLRKSAQKQLRSVLKECLVNPAVKCWFRWALWTLILLILCVPLKLVLGLVTTLLIAGFIAMLNDYRPKRTA